MASSWWTHKDCFVILRFLWSIRWELPFRWRSWVFVPLFSYLLAFSSLLLFSYLSSAKIISELDCILTRMYLLFSNDVILVALRFWAIIGWWMWSICGEVLNFSGHLMWWYDIVSLLCLRSLFFFQSNIEFCLV